MNYFQRFIRYKLLNPRTWGRSSTCAMVWTGIFGVVIGAGTSYYLDQTWMEFEDIRVFYVGGQTTIHVSTKYDIVRLCNSVPLWRLHAEAPDGQVSVYGPKPDLPPMDKGEHIYSTDLPLPHDTYPDGWMVRIVVTCAGAEPEMVASPGVFTRKIDVVVPHGGGL